MLDHVLSLKKNQENFKNKSVEYNLSLFAHKRSGFDSYVVLNDLPEWQSVVSLIKNGAGIVSLKIFNGYMDQTKKHPQYVLFRCGLLHIENSFKK